LQLRSEGDALAVSVEEQRLFAAAVTRKKDRLADRVPKRESEHSAKAPDAGRPPRLISGQEHLGVGASLEALAERLQFGAQLQIVVNLAVVGDDIAAARELHGLAPALGQVDDGKSQ